jgi:hypothetical protein
MSRNFSPRSARSTCTIRLAACVLVVAIALVGTAVAQPAAGGDSGWWMAFQAGAGTVNGQVRVGEPSPSTSEDYNDFHAHLNTLTGSLAFRF